MLSVAICDDDLNSANKLRSRLKVGFKRQGIKNRITVFDSSECFVKALEDDNLTHASDSPV